MLTGVELGAAIDAARVAKGVSKADMARHFNVKPPSVTGWIETGRINKAKLVDLIAYFSPVVGYQHWGLSDPLGNIVGEGGAVIKRLVEASAKGHLTAKEWALITDLVDVLIGPPTNVAADSSVPQNGRVAQ